MKYSLRIGEMRTTVRAGAALEVTRSAELLEVLVPIRTVSEANQRDHHYAKAKRVSSQRGAIALGLRWLMKGRPPALPVTVTLTRLGLQLLDDDNLRPALKACRDQIAVEIGLPVNAAGQADDRDPRVTWVYDQERAKTYAVRIRIEARR